ncbi:MAG TPA: hypothetical protein VK968_19550 [Roseimicrobium sp.]|nr:hypothetical protein [Roseimicrobium sp.]
MNTRLRPFAVHTARSNSGIAVWARRRDEAGFVPAWKMEGMIALAALGLFLAVAVPAAVKAYEAGASVLWAILVGVTRAVVIYGSIAAVIYLGMRFIMWREAREQAQLIKAQEELEKAAAAESKPRD